MGTIKLAEPLHIVIQGEGPNLGKPMILMRVAGCNVYCVDCDSKGTWTQVFKEYDVIELKKELEKLRDANHDLSHILITGGNPELYQEELKILIPMLCDTFYWKFDIEIPGLISWEWAKFYDNRIQFNVSPKIGSLKGKDLEYNFFTWKPRNFIVKVVVKEETFDKNLEDIEVFSKKYSLLRKNIYLMPQGTTREEIIKGSQFLIDKCFELDFNFTTRLHVLIYDNKKLV